MLLRLVAVLLVVAGTMDAAAKECWALTNLKGVMAASTLGYKFSEDGYSQPMVLCFNDDGTGTVMGDTAQFMRIGASSLVGVGLENGAELVESYQIDRDTGSVLFTKSRIGTDGIVPGGPDVVAAFVGTATKLP